MFCNILLMFCKVLYFFVIFGGPTDRLTDQQTDLCIKAPSRSLKTLAHVSYHSYSFKFNIEYDLKAK